MYFLDVALIWVAVALNTAYEVAPIIEKKFPDELLKAFVVLILGFILAFYSRWFLSFGKSCFMVPKTSFLSLVPN